MCNMCMRMHMHMHMYMHMHMCMLCMCMLCACACHVCSMVACLLKRDTTLAEQVTLISSTLWGLLRTVSRVACASKVHKNP